MDAIWPPPPHDPHAADVPTELLDAVVRLDRALDPDPLHPLTHGRLAAVLSSGLGLPADECGRIVERYAARRGLELAPEAASLYGTVRSWLAGALVVFVAAFATPLLFRGDLRLAADQARLVAMPVALAVAVPVAFARVRRLAERRAPAALPDAEVDAVLDLLRREAATPAAMSDVLEDGAALGSGLADRIVLGYCGRHSLPPNVLGRRMRRRSSMGAFMLLSALTGLVLLVLALFDQVLFDTTPTRGGRIALAHQSLLELAIVTPIFMAFAGLTIWTATRRN